MLRQKCGTPQSGQTTTASHRLHSDIRFFTVFSSAAGSLYSKQSCLGSVRHSHPFDTLCFIFLFLLYSYSANDTAEGTNCSVKLNQEQLLVPKVSRVIPRSGNRAQTMCCTVFCKIFTVFGDDLMEQTATQTVSTLNSFESQFLGIPRRGKEQHETNERRKEPKEKDTKKTHSITEAAVATFLTTEK